MSQTPIKPGRELKNDYRVAVARLRRARSHNHHPASIALWERDVHDYRASIRALVYGDETWTDCAGTTWEVRGGRRVSIGSPA